MTMLTTSPAEALREFHWEPQPQAEQFIRELLESIRAKLPIVQTLEQRLRDETGSRLLDWTDAILLPATNEIRGKLQAAGFEPEAHPAEEIFVFSHSGGIFPRVGLKIPGSTQLMIKVENVADFASAWAISHDRIEGSAGASVRKVRVSDAGEYELWAIERHGDRRFNATAVDASLPAKLAMHGTRFRSRPRAFEDESEGFIQLRGLIDQAIQDLGRDRACDLFFQSEREYWQSRNRAARFQKSRQDKLGLGWGNHDHHTYRSSREHFSKLIAIHEQLGLVCRERFYAGTEAGWGAQVMENPVAGVITFNDVDLTPDELVQDFAHEPLAPLDHLRTVGLWCALHGEAIFQAGMHHLECQFDFDLLKQQLEGPGHVKVMKPFTDLPYLRQAFTEGEQWIVEPKRVHRALDRGWITKEQAERFLVDGAIGSHLENLQRDQGFKGFNQKGVSDIIARTDPRNAQG